MRIRKFNIDELHGENIVVAERRGDTSFELHWHEYYEMILYIDCRGSCSVNDTEYKISPSTIFLLTPTDFHKIDTVPTEASRYIKVSFSVGAVDESLSRDGGLRPKILHAPDLFLVKCFEQLLKAEGRARSDSTRHLLNFVLTELMHKGETAKSYNGFFHPTVKRAAIYTLEHFDEQLTLSEVAKKVGTGTAYLSSIFHETMGRTFKDWLTELRIDQAKRLLLSGVAVTDTAMECGFGNLSHFIKCFKERVGMTPGQYRTEGGSSDNPIGI